MASEPSTPPGGGAGTSTQAQTASPGWVKLVAIVGLAWNLLGTLAFFWYTVLMEMFVTPEAMAALPEAERVQLQLQLDMVQAMPSWVTWVFAIAVFGGVLGCILMLMKRKLAVPVFALSLAGIVIQNIHSFGIARVHETFGASTFIQPALVFIIGVFLLWVAIKAKNAGWSR